MTVKDIVYEIERIDVLIDYLKNNVPLTSDQRQDVCIFLDEHKEELLNKKIAK